MAPFSPSKHGVVQCRSLKYNDLDGFTNNDGAGGDWPVSEPPNEGVHKHPGVIAADSVNGEGTIDYWRESISSTPRQLDNKNDNPRNSDISLEQDASPTPSSLASDLSHYKDLFSKLRFSYLEQVTKEKFLRAIVGDPPLIVENAENLELESQLKEIKAVLREQKEMVGRMVQELEVRGRDLGARYGSVQLQMELMQRLPVEIAGLDQKCRVLEAEIEAKMAEMGGLLEASTGIGVDGIGKAIREKEMRTEEVERKLRDLRGKIPEREGFLQTLKRDLKGLERERNVAVQGAREAVKGRERGGLLGDELEMKGRWLSGCEEGLRGLLGLEAGESKPASHEEERSHGVDS
ncbi:MAG: hypothetical protein LQ352_000710 [Teloschistes flavicans]|nr:MAG: hypothetical protein LQ352_000710 [Teloschistes flavicans]